MLNHLPVSYQGNFPSPSLALHVHLKSWKVKNVDLLLEEQIKRHNFIQIFPVKDHKIN